MNVITNKEPTAKIRGFNGLWSRGSDITCPADHLTDCYNSIFLGPNQVSIRENFTVQNDIPGDTIISFAIAILASGAGLLTLNSTGNIVDETHAILLGGPFTGADDFTVLNIFGRTYISLKQKGKAYPGGSLYYYDGVSLKLAAGTAPIAAVTLTQPNAGTVDAGVHTVAVSFVTATGFLTGFSPTVAITSTGAKTISISNIPLGPVGTIARVLSITKANESEMFFIPGGQINDNITTTFEYTNFDSSLINSSDYLNNILATINSVAALKFYKGRMVLIGRDGSPDNILVSDISSPETFNLVNNIINLPVDFGIATASGGLIIRDVLYITKPNSTYSVQDNLGNPNTWGVSITDSGIGAYDAGLSVFASSMSAQDVFDSSLVVNKRGLMFFNGAYADIPLTYKIQGIWDLLNADLFYKVQIAHDTWYKRVYIAVPLNPASTYGARITSTTNNNLILMMDYQDGMNPQAVKWSVWTYGSDIKKISVENFTLNYTDATMIYQFAMCQGGPIIWKLNPPPSGSPAPDLAHAGAKTSINQYIITAPVMPGGINTFTALDLTINGYGALVPSLYDKNRVIGPLNQRTFKLDSYSSSINLQRLINLQTEGMQTQLKADQSLPAGNQGFFTVEGIDVYSNRVFNMRPALVETL